MALLRRTWITVIIVAIVNPFYGLPGGVRKSFGSGTDCCSCTPWAGIYPTVVMPFCHDGQIDAPSLERQIHFHVRGGVRGVLVLGTIGEGEYATLEERAQVIATAVRAAGPSVPVVVGIHTYKLDCAAIQVHQAKELGAAAVLVKFIGKPQASVAEVLGFYSALCDLSPLPIFYYHYPSETKLHLSAQDVAHIISLPGIVGIKESTLNLREVRDHICLTRGQGKTFLSGTALNLTQFMDLGGHGAMCPEAVLLPGPTVQAYAAYRRGCRDEARSIQSEFFEMIPILRARPTPPAMARLMLTSAQDHMMPVPMGKDQPQARLKAALNFMDLQTPVCVKCPLPPLTCHDRKQVESAVSRLVSIDWCGAAMKVPPVPLHRCAGEDSGVLLRTGSFQLGPGVGRDMLRSQGDGESGF
jgi:4-hydroxy-tetrahydrodipicolinate synthase